MLHLISAAWNPSAGEPNRWIQADFGARRVLYSITTQGSSDFDNWIISYFLSVGDDGVNWQDNPKRFVANTDQHTRVTHQLPVNTIARFIRLHPDFHRAYGTVRWDVRGGEQKQQEREYRKMLLDGVSAVWKTWELTMYHVDLICSGVQSVTSVAVSQLHDERGALKRQLLA